MSKLSKYYFYDEKGLFMTDKYENNVPPPFLYLTGIINKDLKLTPISYPNINASTSEKLLKKVKIFIDAEKEKLKYIRIDAGDVIVFREEFVNDAILLKYFYSMNFDSNSATMSYIHYMLMGFDKKYIKRGYIYNYIKNAGEKLYSSPELDQLSSRDRYEKIYDLSLKNGDFADIDKNVDKIISNINSIIAKVSASNIFIKYAKKVEVFPFKFIKLDDNPLYLPIKNDINAYMK